jgi:hypothetical protein
MNLTGHLYNDIICLVQKVKKDLRAKGLIIPVKENNGVYRIGHYSIVRNSDGFYSISHVLNSKNIPSINGINLPQTAILIANQLALGRWTNDKIISMDKQYGYGMFEECQYKHMISSMIKKNDWDRADTLLIKQNIAHNKAEIAKGHILMSFEKLCRLQ